MRHPVLLPLIAVLVVATAQARSTGPAAGHANDPPSPKTCADANCHDDVAVNSRNVTLSLRRQAGMVAATTYTAGQAIPLLFSVQSPESGRARWGFQMTALSGTTMAGSFSFTGNLLQVISSPGGARQYLEHQSSGTFPGQTGGAD